MISNGLRITAKLGVCCLLMGFAAGCAAENGNAQSEKSVDPCERSADETTLFECRKRNLDESRLAVEAAMAKLRVSYERDEPERWKLLQTSQNAWSVFRDADCAVKTFDSRGGTAFSVYEMSCFAEYDRERASELGKLISAP